MGGASMSVATDACLTGLVLGFSTGGLWLLILVGLGCYFEKLMCSFELRRYGRLWCEKGNVER